MLASVFAFLSRMTDKPALLAWKAALKNGFVHSWGMRKPQCLQMSSLDPAEILAVSRYNGLHTQLAVRRAVIRSNM